MPPSVSVNHVQVIPGEEIEFTKPILILVEDRIIVVKPFPKRFKDPRRGSNNLFSPK